jgi:rare lipoprotein A
LPDTRRHARPVGPALLALAAVLAVSACSRLPAPRSEAGEVGVASWYGNEFHGRPTSSGEVFDQNDLTAAHRTLPFGTHVMVTNLANDSSVVVRINDRGPFVRERIIDLSYAAARVLGLIGPGTGRVRLDVLGGAESPARAGPATVWVQVGAFSVQENAHKLKRELEASYAGVVVSSLKTDRGVYYRVRVRTDEGAAAGLARRLAAGGYPVIIVRE